MVKVGSHMKVSFIKEKDKSIAVLLFDLANIDYLLGKKSSQYKELYKMAVDYGFDKKFVESQFEIFIHEFLHL